MDGEPATMGSDLRQPINGVTLAAPDLGRKLHATVPSANGPIGVVDLAGVRGPSIELRARGWVYVAPYAMPSQSTNPGVPQEAVWSARVDLTRTVRIEE